METAVKTTEELINTVFEDLEQYRETVAEQDEQISKFITHELQNSILMQEMRKFICTWLDEFEARFEREKQADSVTIAEDYVKQATWMQDNFGRKNHSVEQVQRWIDWDNLPW